MAEAIGGVILYDESFEQSTADKPNMVLAGYECPDQPGDEEVVERTLRCLRRHVPGAVPGIVFLSGGQSDEDATTRLNLMNQSGPQPWEVSFSYGRGLQAAALNAWRGESDNVAAAQAQYRHRARCTGAALRGEYSPKMESELSAAGSDIRVERVARDSADVRVAFREDRAGVP